jgi:hypothetical protein
MKIVTDGEKYAIQTGWWFFKEYIDLYDQQYSFKPCSRFEKFCWGTKEQVIEVYEKLRKRKNTKTVSIEKLKNE